MELTDIIAAEVKNLEDPVDTDVAEPEILEDPVPETPPAETPAETTEEKPPVVEDKKTVETKVAAASDGDDIDKVLAEHGVKAPVEGQKENRIPYARVRKIVGNALKKLGESHTAALSEREVTHKTLQAELDGYKKTDQIAFSDPERYLGILAAMRPDLYKKYLAPPAQTPSESKPAAAETVVADLGPKPAPDVKFEDGSMGYSPEQFQKREDWLIAKAKAEAKAEAVAEAEALFTKRFGPMEEQFKASQIARDEAPRIKAQVAAATETWGDLFVADYQKQDKSEILQAMIANSRARKLDPSVPILTFDAACAKILAPRLRERGLADKTKIRQEVMAEQRERAKAASKVTTTTAAAVIEDDGGDPLQKAIRDAIRHLPR